MPVIRYRTRDLTRLLPGTARTMRRMEKVTGRSDDMLIVRGVNVFPSEVERVLLEHPELAPHYEIVVDRRHALDTLEVQAELAALLDDITALAALRERVNHALDAALGISTDVALQAPGTLPRSEGKAQRVRDKRVVSH